MQDANHFATPMKATMIAVVASQMLLPLSPPRFQECASCDKVIGFPAETKVLPPKPQGRRLLE